MKHWSRVAILSFVLIIALSVALPQKAYAYIDPGTGSYLFQLLMAAVFVGIFGVRILWGKIKAFSKRLFSPQDKRDEDAG
jgi:hypothetical protein